MTETHRNLLASAGAGPAPTLLPEDPAAADLAARPREQFLQTVAAHPDSTLCWALLAEGALAVGSLEGDLGAYAYARTGYHRGLDALRRAGWKGSGPVPWQHVPNQGFLRALWALALAAERIGETTEHERCAQFLRDSSEEAFTHLSAASEGLRR
ncbi:MAG: FIG01121295: hypothetical protein [uncultured Friedmanniella sp.]|uniref:DUF3151 domain-containing protein n=1 Tax=uncultured Friedmanniella sp. TaxID=335381 RepID=A0A6J4K1U0_9ACTN|nr:DUF3151 domain-containing protein [uncultured Friedmanniella sp.]CAA9293515.1 MAG: FIG01121295: hypothetical protein [uncultured Friedmanniella sp.]